MHQHLAYVIAAYTQQQVRPIAQCTMLQELPRFDSDGAVVREAVMGISWGADHRVVDGATLTHFSNAVKALLEEPQRLLLHMR